MFVMSSPNFVADTKMFCYNFGAHLKENYQKVNP